MATKTPKKKDSKERASSSTAPKSAVEQSVSVSGDKDDRNKKGVKAPVVIWSEWSDVDIAAEKWDIPHKGKDKEKGKSPNLHAFEDPEGRVDLPSLIQSKVECWRRPVDFIEDKVPVVVDPESLKEKDVDLLSCSAAISDSQVMRSIIADITNLVKLKPKLETIEAKSSKEVKDKEKPEGVQNEESVWKPWQHIWPKEKNKFGLYSVYNPGGKYIVKIFWLGCWRKITVDDWMPFDSDGALLLPTTKKCYELWPMLLAKALIKVASLDYQGGDKSCEFGDFNVVQCLTGWMPEIIPLRREHSSDLWSVLGKILPHWKLENSAAAPTEEPTTKEVQNVKSKKDEGSKKGKDKSERGFTSQTTSERSSERESRLKDKDSKEKFLGNGSSSLLKDVAKEPEFAIFAAYSNPPASPTTLAELREMADASEKLRQLGLSHNHPHSISVTLFRDCPLVAPPPPVEVPRWKLIRQKKRKQPRDPRLTPVEPPKEPRFLEITSPFVSYCVSPTPVGRITTPWSKRYYPDKEVMGEIEEEGDKSETKSAPDKDSTNDVEQKIEEVATESTTKTPESSKLSNGRAEKQEERKQESGKSQKEQVKSGKSERPTSVLAEAKQGKGKKGAKGEQKGEQSTRSPNARRMSKTEVKGLAELKKAGKTVSQEAKQEESTPVADDATENMSEDVVAEEYPEGMEANEIKKKEKKLWIEYDEFWKCFSTLYIYHKPLTYTYFKSHLELKNVAAASNVKKSGIGIHTPSAATASNLAGKNLGVAPSPVGHHALAGIPIEPPPPFLFVDSAQPIEIVVNFTSFSKWLDPPLPIFREKGKDSNTDLKSDSVIDTTTQPSAPPAPGLLVAEPYTWKSLVTGTPCLRMKTTGSKAAVLVLKPGRHVLRLLLQSPNGYHVGLCSQTPFSFGDEDTIMSCLTKESCRFIESTTAVLQNIGNIITMFSDLSTNEKHTMLDLGLPEQTKHTQNRYHQAFMSCLSETLSAQLGDDYTRDMHFAWKAFDYICRVYLKERCTFRPRSSADVSRIGGKVPKTESDLTRKLSLANQDEGVLTDDLAATRIQASFKGYYVRKLNEAYKQDTETHQKVNEQLTKAWDAMESHLETYATHLYRRIFKLEPDLLQCFPFHEDEWNRVSYNDYNGTFPEQPPNNWFLIFREVFFVDEEVLVLPKMYTSVSTCFLRVINNDTFEELPKVFQRVAPHTFRKNKRGYTFLAEARSCSSSLSAGKFRLRLIGSSDPLPAPESDTVNSQFVAKEIRDYYLPNKDNVILRYSVHVTEDLLISVQLCTSKPDVLLKLQLLDNEEEILSCNGRGHAVLPVYIARRDRHAGEEEGKRKKKGSRPQSKDSNKERPTSERSATAGSKSQKSKTKKSGKETSPVHSRPNSAADKRGEGHTITQDEDMTPQVHKYIIQALVLRDTWPLSRDDWDFVEQQKNAEKLEYELSENSSRAEKSASQNKTRKSKDGKDSRSSKNQPGSRPASQLQFDATKPNWTLRVIADANIADDIDVRRDTERLDEIRAMKLAWEAAQPGRAAKAYQSRQKFLNENLMKIEDEDEGDDQQTNTAEMKSSSTSAVAAEQEELFIEPPPRQPSRILKKFDVTPYVRCEGAMVLLDEDEENRRREKRQEIFRQHKAWREGVEKRRELDRLNRNKAKERQIQQAEEWQAALDKVRDEINTTREVYRKTFIPEEPPEPEEPSPSPVRTPSPGKGRKSSKSPKTARGKKK